MGQVNKPEKTRSDIHAEFMAKLSPALIDKVSRLVSQRKAAHAALMSVSDEYLQVHAEIKNMENDRERVRKSSANDGRSDWNILGHRIEAAKLRRAQIEAQKQRMEESWQVAISVGEGVVKAVADEFGGGVYQTELFETLGWR
ncbi:hypothetical protein BOTU111921_00120 [Bordetella tumbae]|uniref:hypothetical protein n=1 Tax=Bordetella tumbae TaxID=1649139 RepID=UPI0039EDFB5D